MSYGINKKNLRLKNLSFITPLSNPNTANLISESQRLITNSNNNRVNLPQTSTNEQHKNQLLNEVFKSYSSNRQINTHNQLKKQNINLNYITNNQILNNINLKNMYKKTTTSPSNSSMYNTFANFPTNLIKGKNYIYSNNSNNKNVFKNSSQNHTRNIKNKKNSLTNNSSLNNFNLTQGKENNLLLSTNIINNSNNNNPVLNSSTSQFQKYTSNIDMLSKKKNLIIHNNTHHHQQNFSSDFVNNFNTPLSASTSMNNVVNFYNEIYNNKLDYSKNNINSGLNNSKGNNYISYQSDQNAFNTTKESTIGKKFIKTLNSNSCNSNNENEFSNTKNIESPEELHFYFINVIQNGKELEGKFDITNSINSKN